MNKRIFLLLAACSFLLTSCIETLEEIYLNKDGSADTQIRPNALLALWVYLDTVRMLDLMARLAVVPMVLEARGLDVTPGIIEIFERASPSVVFISTRQRVEVNTNPFAGSPLGQLFRRPVQQANVRIRLLDDLALDFEHETQNAVGRGMLRAEVHRVALDLSHRHDP